MWNELQKKFPKQWNSTSSNILKAASIIVEAKDTLATPLYKTLKQKLQLSDRIAQGLVKIGRTKRFYDDDVKSILPDSWGTIEALSSLDVSKLNELVKLGGLHRKLTRKEVEKHLKRPSAMVETVDWSHTNKVITVRVDKDMKDARYIEKVKEAIIQTIDTLKDFDEMISVHYEDHMLDIKVNESEIMKVSREFTRDQKLGLKWGKKICSFERRRQRRNASSVERQRVALHQITRGWSALETKSEYIEDEDDLKHAFSELGIDWIDVDELMRDPSIGEREYEKLKRTS